ncbi:MAG: UbiA family prenyltransferase [Planctomycetota bacterium]
MKALGRLLRLSLSPTAAADIAAGVVAGAGGWIGGSAPFLLILASLCVYHGGMVLNDWRDREEDRRVRSDRPIPSGRIPAGAALILGLALLAAGPVIALRVSPSCGAAIGAVALAALLYDLALRGAWLGPLLLAFCRGANLAAGLLLGSGGSLGILILLPPLLYAAYVFTVSRLARLEDADRNEQQRASPSWLLGVAAVLLLLAPCAALLHPLESLARPCAALLLAAAGALGLIRAAHRPGIWSSEDLTRATGFALRRLLVFTAAVALSAGGTASWIVAGAILCGYPVSFALRGVFPPS